MSFKSGFIALIGRPNAGKSTLLNAILQTKVAIMSNKPQTTRNVIQGIKTTEHAQYIFIDTPGIHKPKHELGRQMSKSALNSAFGVDVVYFLADASKPYGRGDAFILESLKQMQIPVFLLLNKIDLLTKEELILALQSWQEVYEFSEIIPLSARKEDNLATLLQVTDQYLKEGTKYYPDDTISDHSDRFMIGELIREKVLHLTSEEIPHSVAVIIDELKWKKESIAIHATIYVERDSQKGIIIGKQGSLLKEVGTKAREEMEAMFGKKVYLELFVRVEKDWRNRQRILQRLGYSDEDDL